MTPMTLEIAAGGRTHAVVIEPTGAPGCYRLTIDGEATLIEAIATAGGAGTTWSLRDTATGAVSAIAVAIGPGGDGEAVVGGHAIAVALAGRRAHRRDALDVEHGAQRLVAPMAGKVIKVLVQAGDAVVARQALVVVEAMKMENELTAFRAGTVTEVAVVEGVSVDKGRLLVVVAESVD